MHVPRPRTLGLPPHFETFRPHQFETADRIARSAHRTTVVNAPTGVGKSLIYSTSSALLGLRTLVLVRTKALQDQNLAGLGGFLHDIRGHGNYPCAIGRVDDGDGGFECSAPPGECGYRDRDVPLAQQAERVQTNYAHWLSLAQAGDPDRLGKFDLLVLDEGHNAHDEVTNHLTITILPQQVSRLLGLKTPGVKEPVDRWPGWATHARGVLRERYQDTQRSAGLSKRDRNKKLAELSRLDRDLVRVVGDVGAGEWLVLSGSGFRETINLQPVWGGKLARRYLYHNIPRVLLVSATVGIDDARELGLTATEDPPELLELPSPFEIHRRPFYYLPTAMVDHRLDAAGWGRLADRVHDIWLSRRMYRGLVHTHSYERQETLVSCIYERHKDLFDCLRWHERGGLATALQHYLQDPEPSLLVSPSLEEGYDFPDDAARYQIILKVPYLDGRDPLTAARTTSDKGYRYRVAARTLTQTYGRIVRSPTDWGDTFMLDWHFGKFRNNPHVHHSPWFQEAWIEVGGVPPLLSHQ
jgi:Rad3-related DNA helicase